MVVFCSYIYLLYPLLILAGLKRVFYCVAIFYTPTKINPQLIFIYSETISCNQSSYLYTEHVNRKAIKQKEYMRNEKTANKYSWPQYLSFCKRLCPKNLSFNLLVMTVDFYSAYKNEVSHRRLMCEIEHVASLNWLTPEQRHERLAAVINNK